MRVRATTWKQLRSAARRSLACAGELRQCLRFVWVFRQRPEIERLESRMLFSFALTGTETLVNTNLTYAELNPVIAMDGSGNYVVVWSNNGQDGHGWGVFGQRFNASGTPTGAEFRINQTTTGDQAQPAVAMNSSGSFIVSWTSSQNGGDIYAREYDSSGTATGNEFLVSGSTSGKQENSAVAIDSSGDFVIAWDGQGPTDTQGIFSQRYVVTSLLGTGLFASLTPQGVGEVNTTIDHQQQNPTIAMDGGGAYVIAWTDKNSAQKIKARLGTAAGGLSGSEFLVGTSGSLHEDDATASMDSSGSFAVAWQEQNSGSADLDIEARRYNASGTALDATPIAVNAYTKDQQQNPTLSMRSGGSFIVAWQSKNQDGNKDGIFAQGFNSDGTHFGGQFQVNTTSHEDQQNPAVAWVGSNAIVAWNGNGVGDANGIFAQRLTIANVANVAPGLITPASQSIAEGGSLTFSSAGGDSLAVSDSDGGAGVEQVTLTATNGTLTLASGANISITSGTGAGDTAVTFNGELADLNTTLNGLVFTPNANFFGAGAVAISINDLGNTGSGGALSASGSVAITVNRIAHTPTVTNSATNENTQSASGLVISPNSLDSSLSGFFEITGITGGALFQNDRTTPITNGQFITFAQGSAGLRFTPTTNSITAGSFIVEASTTNTTTGLGGSTAAATVTISPVPLLSAPSTATTLEDVAQTFSGAGGNAIIVSDPGNPGGAASVTLTATNGTLTLASAAGITITSGSASGASGVTFTGTFSSLNSAMNGLRFVPATHYSGAASLAISVTEGSNVANATVAETVTTVAHTPSITAAKTVLNEQTAAGLVVTRNPIDGPAVNFLKITGITGGALFQQDGTTAINNGDFITFAQGSAGLRFTPTTGSTASGALNLQASTTNDDSGLGGLVVAAVITVAGPPVNQAPAAQTISEDASLVFSSGQLISVDDPSIGSGTDSVVLAASSGTLTLATGSGVTITSGTGAGDTTVSFSGTLARLRAALNGLTFTPDQHFFGAASLQITTSDPGNVGANGALSDTDTVPVTVNRLAHQPTVTSTQTIETAQTSSGLVITPNSLDASLAGFLKITAVSGGTLFLADGTTPVIAGQFITFVQGQAGLKFTPVAGSAPGGSFKIQASTTTDDTGLGGAAVTAAVSVTRRPIVGVEAGALNYAEGQDAAQISPALTITDTNGISLAGATLRVIGFVASEDVVQFTDQNGITGSWDNINGALTLTGSASPAAYQAALRSVIYANISQDPSTTLRSAQFTVADASIASNPSNRDISVTALNDRPVISAPGAQTTNEDVPLVFSTANGNAITLADIDSEGHQEQLTLTATNGTLATAADPTTQSATISLTATLGSLNTAIEGLIFTPAVHYSGPAAIDIRLNDLGNAGSPGPQTSAATLVVNVAPIAHTPGVTDAQVLEGTRSSDGPVITPSSADSFLSGYFKISSIAGGTLVQHNGVTPINDGDFITFAQGQAGLRFTPNPGSVVSGTFTIQASTSSSDAGLGGTAVQATIAVTAAPLIVRRSSLELSNQGSSPINTESLYVVAPTGAAEEVSYVLLSLPQHGTLLRDGNALGVNDSFTRVDLDRGAITYAPANDIPSSDTFQFQATDAVGRTTGAATFQIKRQPVPITPVAPAAPSVAPAAPSHQNSGLSDLIATKTASNDSTTTTDNTQKSGPSPASDSGGAAASAGTSDVVSPAAAPEPQATPRGAGPIVARAAAVEANAPVAPASADPQKYRFDRDSVRANFAGTRTLLAGNSKLWIDLDAMKKNMRSEIKVWAGTASFMSIGMSLAYFMWILRAGSLLSSLLSSMPAWSFVDPLPILESMGSGRHATDDEGLEGLVDGNRKKS